MKTINKPHLTPDNGLSVTTSAEILAHWQAGDWDWLASTNANSNDKNITDELTKIRLAIAHCQNGNTEAIERALKETNMTHQNQQAALIALMSGYAASLAKCYLSIGDEHNALRAINESVTFDGLQSVAKTIAPLKLSFQAEHLGLPRTYRSDPTIDQALKQTSIDLKEIFFSQMELNFTQQSLLELLFDVINQLIINREEIELTEIKQRQKSDPFLSGKVMLAVANLLAFLPRNNSASLLICKHFRKAISLFIDAPSETWGNYFFLYALNKFQELDLLEELFSYKELNRLRQKLHYNEFINTDTFELINKPTNFYQVAYGISLFRFHLGWEDGIAKDTLLQKMLAHIEQSSTTGFADESDGKGRYDRYSVLLIAEIAHKFRESGLPLTKQIKTWLKQAADFVLMHANSNGVGFQYGRSIGPYGDSSTNEILSAAAWFGLLNESEKKIAYTYSQLSTERFLHFWWDKENNSVNLWTDGRHTDKYRDKHRILGETLSLLYQHLYTAEIWYELGMHKIVPNLPSPEDKTWLYGLPPAKYYSLDNKDSEYGIFIYRRGDSAYTLPLINGDQYHCKSFYLPIPYNNSTIQGVPDTHFNTLVPKITTPDGRKLMPLCWFKKISCVDSDNLNIISYKQYKFDVITDGKPISDKNFRSETKYTFSKEYITRQDKITCLDGQPIDIEIQFLSFFPAASIMDGDVFFSEGSIEKIHFEGFNEVRQEKLSINDDIGSNEKGYSSIVLAKTKSKNSESTVVEWTIFFRD